MGQRVADLVQPVGTATTFSFTAAKGQAFDIGARGATIASVKVAALSKILGVDYFVDDPNIPQSMISLNGIIILPTTAAGIADASLRRRYFRRRDANPRAISRVFEAQSERQFPVVPRGRNRKRRARDLGFRLPALGKIGRRFRSRQIPRSRHGCRDLWLSDHYHAAELTNVVHEMGSGRRVLW